jgi:hypothetical protein
VRSQVVPDGAEDADDMVVADHDTSLLFDGLKFFLSREVPRHYFEFMARAFGARVGWEGSGSPYERADQSITHEIVDRDFQKHMILSREYVQPQWIADSLNAGLLLPLEAYMPGTHARAQTRRHWMAVYDAATQAERHLRICRRSSTTRPRGTSQSRPSTSSGCEARSTVLRRWRRRRWAYAVRSPGRRFAQRNQLVLS